MARFALGVDIGGTKIAAAVVAAGADDAVLISVAWLTPQGKVV
jgi:predicted NBD/HSP70 family sugar kinase